jgi:cytoskeleton protein RodZ
MRGFMPEIEEKKEEEAVGFIDPPTVQRNPTLGVLLRLAREREGLSRQNLAEIIRLRLFYIQALEEEAWDRLPAPVYVKGFIKSYARVVGLDEKEVLGLYRSQAPQVLAPPFPGIRNKQIRFRKAYGLTVVLFLALLSFLIIYFGNGAGLKRPSQKNLSRQSPASDPVIEPAPIPETEKPVEAQPNVGQLQAERSADTGIPNLGMTPEPVKPDRAANPIRVRPKQTPSGEWILKAFARKETWVNIYKDREPPQDYTFMPGDKREWRAQKGFIVIVGNAAGIDFELNGVKYERLGNPNQVIQLKFPEDFERKANGQ